MDGKPRIAIVASELSHPRVLKLFSPLRQDYELTVMTFNRSQLINQHDSGIRLALSEHLEDIPGYMRGLEQELAHFDAVIAFETNNLAAFQAVRAAHTHRIPSLVIVNEHIHDFYAAFQNIAAIQYDLLRRATTFIAGHAAAAQMLKLLGVEDERIKVLAPFVDTFRFSFDLARRRRFREYVGIDLTTRVVLFQGPMESSGRPEYVLRALRDMHNRGTLASSAIKVVFCGAGTVAQELKYRAYDWGISQHTMFLHQDPEPFLMDLYCAADFAIKTTSLPTEFHECLPYWIFEAASCGVIPIVEAGNTICKYVGNLGKVVGFNDPSELAAIFEEEASRATYDRRAQLHSLCRLNFNVDDMGRALEAVLRDAIRLNDRLQCSDVSSVFSAIEQLIRGKDEGLALVQIEEMLLDKKQMPTKHLSQLLRLKGDAQYAMGDLEQATEVYGDALKYDEANGLAYRGLGNVSWRSHSHDEALIFYKKALAIDPKDQRTMLGIGMVYRRIGLVDEALFWLEKCVAMDPSNGAALASLTQACVECSNPARAAEVLQRLVDSVGDLTALVMALGQVLIKQGKIEDGNDLVRKALSRGDGSPACA